MNVRDTTTEAEKSEYEKGTEQNRRDEDPENYSSVR